MTTPASDLPDTNVWLPLTIGVHIHRDRAKRYWESETAPTTAFCRVTALALLRLWTSPVAAGPDHVTGAAAWAGLANWLAMPHIEWALEPAGMDELLAHWAQRLDLRGASWTDAYLAAFAVASGRRLVSFDRGFARFDGLEWLHLKP